MIKDKNRVFDGWLSLEGGVDAGRMPDALDVNQVVSAQNMTFRGGVPTTRPGFRKLTEDFPEKLLWNGQEWVSKQLWCFGQAHTYVIGGKSYRLIEGEYKIPAISLFDDGIPPPPPPQNEENPPPILPWFANENSEHIYKTGILQCAQAYSPHNGEDCIMAMIGGRLFKIVPGVDTAHVEEVVIENPEIPKERLDLTFRNRHLRNQRDLPIAYMCQADKWMIAQDGKSNAIIYDASKARRSKTTGTAEETEVPVGTIMAYGMGRLVVTVNERDVAFGDLHGSHDLPDPADSLILFTERNFLAEGFDAAIPFTQGKVTGMKFFPQLDTSTGNGQLMVFAERGATNFFLSLERSQWKTSSFQILSSLSTGLRGHRSIAVANEDLWFRSDDGIRSSRQARSEQSGWAHLPLSTNVRQYLDNDSGFLLKFCSAIYFDNRVICTTSPAWHQGRPIHWGMVAVDFDILSSFSGTPQAVAQTSKPAWEGQWTPSSFMFPTQLLTGTFNGINRAFFFAVDNQNQNQLFELSKDDNDDWDGQRINWEFISRSFDFNKLNPQDSTVFTENELYDGDLWLKEIIE